MSGTGFGGGSSLGPAGIVPSYFQFRGTLADAALTVEQLLPPTDGTHTYTLPFASADWAYSEAGGLPPRVIYSGAAARLFLVNLDMHFESTNPAGDVYLPFFNLYRNLVNEHHTHASVIIAPILANIGVGSIGTRLLIQPADYLTLRYGSDSTVPPLSANSFFFMNATATI